MSIKRKKKLFAITADPYNQDCIVGINCEFSDIEKHIKKYNTAGAKAIIKHIDENRKGYDDKDIGLGCLYKEFPKGFAMIINVQDTWIDTTKIVVHECFHLTSYIMRRVGMPLTEESEEAYTYLQEELVRKILVEIYKK